MSHEHIVVTRWWQVVRIRTANKTNKQNKGQMGYLVFQSLVLLSKELFKLCCITCITVLGDS